MVVASLAQDGCNVAHYAVSRNRTELLIWLVEHGVAINHQNKVCAVAAAGAVEGIWGVWCFLETLQRMYYWDTPDEVLSVAHVTPRALLTMTHATSRPPYHLAQCAYLLLSSLSEFWKCEGQQPSDPPLEATAERPPTEGQQQSGPPW
jgi:hypothetical protein